MSIELNQGTELTSLEKKQELLAHHVRLVARKHSHALFVFGSQGGLGKSRTILRTLEEEGVSPILVNSHITPLALYTTLYLNREEQVIFFDDTDSMFASLAHLGLLRSALWGQGQRIVTYNSSQLPADLPSSFEFSSRVIFAVNVIPRRNDAFKAVLSRCDQFELSASNEEIIDLMRSIAAQGFRGLTPEDCTDDFIEENSQDHQLSMRLLGPSLRKVLYARQENLDWRPLIKTQLQTLGRKLIATKRIDEKNQDMRALKMAVSKFPDNVNEQMAYWRKRTGKSRASFYRVLNRFKEESEG